MKTDEVRTKNEKPADESSGKALQRPDHGAASQLHCYNAVSWRLGELFGDNDQPEPPKTKK